MATAVVEVSQVPAVTNPLAVTRKPKPLNQEAAISRPPARHRAFLPSSERPGSMLQ
ncbi:hypothetical protein EV580_6598 [Mycobacterium sp. BK086]|nr:hypothetical protein EV580_6598 [Mycobacterium sp. BK086]